LLRESVPPMSRKICNAAIVAVHAGLLEPIADRAHELIEISAGSMR